jgi:hypothetical protein
MTYAEWFEEFTQVESECMSLRQKARRDEAFQSQFRAVCVERDAWHQNNPNPSLASR